LQTNAAPLVDTLRRHVWRLRDAAHDRIRGAAHRREVFQRIYDENLWGDPESVSGGGSSTVATQAIRHELPVLFERYEIRSVLDAPCGDFHWMQHVVGCLDQYVGLDIVPELVARNSNVHSTTRISFACADIASDPLPRADAILCRDCFIHLPTRLIRGALANFRVSGTRYLLLTNDLDADSYHDIAIGSFRPVNFLRPPFSFPSPLHVVSEAPDSRRQLCLWPINALDI
jgi:SAM-dependent methyltransferase